jgi:hypothetical protein
MSDRSVTRPKIEAEARRLAEARGLRWDVLAEGRHPPDQSDREATTKQYFRATAQAIRGQAIVNRLLKSGPASRN